MTRPTRLVRFGLPALLLLTAVLAVLDARRDGVTADEPIHVAAGVLQARHGSWAVNVELPPLAKELQGQAALHAGAVSSPPLSFRTLFLSARAQLFGAADPLRILFAARLAGRRRSSRTAT